jgi:hypothetical protein
MPQPALETSLYMEPVLETKRRKSGGAYSSSGFSSDTHQIIVIVCAVFFSLLIMYVLTQSIGLNGPAPLTSRVEAVSAGENSPEENSSANTTSLKSEVSLPAGWRMVHKKNAKTGMEIALALPEGFTLSVSDKGFLIQDNQDNAEAWKFSLSEQKVDGELINTYEGDALDQWYEKFSSVDVSRMARQKNADVSYYEVTAKISGDHTEKSYLYEKDQVVSVLQAVSPPREGESSPILENLGTMFGSLQVL